MCQRPALNRVSRLEDYFEASPISSTVETGSQLGDSTFGRGRV
jgi:hypothetical protein